VAGIAILAALTAVSVPASGTHRFLLGATLTTKQETPQPRHYSPRAGGDFSATYNAKTRRLTWRLTFHNLTTRTAKAAGIYAAFPEHTGFLLIPLCGPCNSGAQGSVKLNEWQKERRPWYVNVRTSRNPSGEIRGQVGVQELPYTGGGAGGGGGGGPVPVVHSVCCPPG
jgi:hypothetical protein